MSESWINVGDGVKYRQYGKNYLEYVDNDEDPNYLCLKCDSLESLPEPKCMCGMKTFALGLAAILFLVIPAVLILVNIIAAGFRS